MTNDNMPPPVAAWALIDEKGKWLKVAISASSDEEMLTLGWTPLYTSAYAEQQTEELSKAYENLGASVMNLSHPNCQLLLADKRKAEQQTAELRQELAFAKGSVDRLLAEVDRLKAALRNANSR